MRRLCLLLPLFVGCAERPAPPSSLDAGPTVPEPLFPAISAEPAGALPKWASALPDVTLSLEKDQRVWATPPRPGSEMAEIGVYKVIGAYGNVASLVNTMNQQLDRVPGAVIHPVGQMKKLHQGDRALFFTWTTPAWIGEVSHAKAGDQLRIVFDWAGTSKSVAVDHAERPRNGIAPLARVGFPKAGQTSVGTIVAVDDKRAWIHTSSGHIEIHPRKELVALGWPKKREIDQAVRAYAWSTGLRDGKIVKEVEPGLRYQVKHTDGSEETYFFDALFSR